MAFTVTALMAVGLAACSRPSAAGAFCDRLTAVQEAGPLFPSRTDGEPVPNLAALAAIEELADRPPDIVAEHVQVLVDEARSLASQAAARMGQTAQVEAPERRWSRNVVESAQSAVAGYAQEECGIELTSAN